MAQAIIESGIGKEPSRDVLRLPPPEKQRRVERVRGIGHLSLVAPYEETYVDDTVVDVEVAEETLPNFDGDDWAALGRAMSRGYAANRDRR